MKYKYLSKNANAMVVLTFILSSSTVFAASPTAGNAIGKKSENTLPSISESLECSIYEDEVVTNRNPLQDSSLLPKTLRKVNTQCRIDARTAQNLWRENKAVIVDVRSLNEFNQFRIPNSLNLPAHSVKSKPFLKSKPLILLNKGFSSYELDILCDNLKQAGFPKVMVLDGGMVAWSKKGKLEGDLNAVRQLNRLSPREYELAKAERNFKPVYMGKRDKKVESLGVSMFISPNGDEENLTTSYEIIEKLTESDEQGSAEFLIFNEDGSNYPAIEKAIKNSAAGNIYYLQGGLKRYLEYRTNHNLILARTEAGPRHVKPCGK
jgi:rhodanese-related sulfurtransferase